MGPRWLARITSCRNSEYLELHCARAFLLSVSDRNAWMQNRLCTQELLHAKVGDFGETKQDLRNPKEAERPFRPKANTHSD